jgi:hypothetical protein
MVTESAADTLVPSETWSRKVSACGAGEVGAVKVGRAAVTSDSVTPDGGVQAYVSGWLSGSWEAVPSRVTRVPGSMSDWSGPALAIGTRFGAKVASVLVAVGS